MKVVCESCGTSFLYDVVKDLQKCPVCGQALWNEEDGTENSVKQEPSFGEGIELGENDSFDEDKIDYWWYSIREPGTLGETDRGSVNTTCSKCNRLSSAPYPIAKGAEYLLIDARYRGRCGGCGNEMKNHILSKRPDDWVDPRKTDMWTKDYENLPKCPTCSSTNIKKISATSKVASVAMWGVLSRKVHKQWHCNICGSEW